MKSFILTPALLNCFIDMADKNSTYQMFTYLRFDFFVCLGFFPFFQKEEKKEDSFADILELSTHTEQDHRSQRFSVWFTVSQPLQPLFIKKNSNLQQTNPQFESTQFDSAENKQTNKKIIVLKLLLTLRERGSSGARGWKSEQLGATIV